MRSGSWGNACKHTRERRTPKHQSSTPPPSPPSSLYASRKRVFVCFSAATAWIEVRRALAGAHLLETQSRPFFAWDLLTVAQLVHPELFTTSEVDCDVVVGGASQGRVVRTEAGGGVAADQLVSWMVLWLLR